MKKLVLLVALLVTANLAFAQKPEKGSSTKAESYLAEGDLAAAKTEIDNTEAYEVYKLESKGKPVVVKSKTIYVKGQVYAAIATSDDETTNALADEAASVAVESYNKVMEVESEGSVYHTFASQKKQELYATFFNKAVELYNAEDMEGALTGFEKVALVSPTDTNALQNAVSIAYDLKKEDKVMVLAQKLIDVDFKKGYLYRMMAQYDIDRASDLDKENEEGKNPKANEYYENALEILKSGLEANPDDSDIASTVFTLYRRLDRVDEALASVDKSIEINPENKALYLQKGFLLDEMGKFEDAVATYKKATEIDPQYFDAYYSIGRIYYNRGAEVSRELNDLDLDKYGRPKDKKKYNELETQMMDQFKLAMDPFEKAYAINGTDQDVIAILSRVYNQLGMKDKYAEISKKLED